MITDCETLHFITTVMM